MCCPLHMVDIPFPAGVVPCGVLFLERHFTYILCKSWTVFLCGHNPVTLDDGILQCIKLSKLNPCQLTVNRYLPKKDIGGSVCIFTDPPFYAVRAYSAWPNPLYHRTLPFLFDSNHAFRFLSHSFMSLSVRVI